MSYVSFLVASSGRADAEAFIAALTKYPQQSYQQLLVSVREEMRGKYSQKPQLSACHREAHIASKCSELTRSDRYRPDVRGLASGSCARW